jgi:hypothetical protein
MKNILLLLGFLFCFPCLSQNLEIQNHSADEFLKKYNLHSDSLLLVYLVNPGECSKVRAPIKVIEEKTEGMPVKKIFLFRGLRQKEVAYYVQNELKEKESQYYKALSDDYFFTYFRPEGNTGLIGIKGSEVSFNFEIFEASQKIKVKDAEEIKLNFTDSVLLNENRSPYSLNIQSVSFKPDTMYILDNRYNSLRKIELNKGNEVDWIDFSKFYREVYNSFFVGNKWKTAFALKNRPQVLKTGLSECNTSAICTNGDYIYVLANFLIIEFDSLFEYGKDTNQITTYYPFIFKIDQHMRLKSVYPISMDFSAYTIASSNFQLDRSGSLWMEYKMKKKIFVKPYLINHQESPEYFIGEFKLKGSRYVFTNKLLKEMPEYFLSDKKAYSCSIGNFVNFNDSLAYYFNLLPNIYLLNSGRSLQLNDTTFKSSFNYQNPFDHFDLRYAFADKNKNICCLYSKADRFYYCVLDKISGSYLFEKELPKTLKGMSVSNTDSEMYFTKVGDANTTVYKYTFGNP